MELSEYLGIARRHWRSITAIALLGLMLAATASLLTTPKFTSRSSILFAVQSANSAGDLAQGTNYAEKQVQSFAEVATAPVVLQPVIDRLGLATTPAGLRGSVTATVPQKTVIVEITVVNPDPVKAAAIANAISEELSNAAAQLTPKNPAGQATVLATVIEPALPSSAPASPRVTQNLALGLLLGLAAGYGLALLRKQLDTRIRAASDIEAVTETSVIGEIPLDGNTARALVVDQDPLGPRAEAYRRLATTLKFLNVDSGPRALMVTSALPGEGKTSIVINLGLALAETHRSVLIIDADLRRPKIGDTFAMESQVGLTTVLIGAAELDDVVQPYGDDGLFVLPVGQTPPNPGELLGSRRMQKLIELAVSLFDVVLIDCPPVLPVADAGVLARLVGGAIVVVGAGRSSRPQLRETLDSLTRSGAQIDGIVLNMVRRRESERYGYYTYEPRANNAEHQTTAARSVAAPVGQLLRRVVSS